MYTAISSGYEVRKVLFKIRNSPPNTGRGLQLSQSDHTTFNIFLRAQSRISHQVTEQLVLVFPPFILPILFHESDSHNTFLSLTFFRNSEAALSPTKMFGCCVTAKHFTICFPSSSLNLDCASKKVPHIFQYDTEIQMKGLFLKRKKGYKRHDPYQIMEPMIPYSLLCQFPSSSKKKKNSMLFCIIVGQLRKTQ